MPNIVYIENEREIGEKIIQPLLQRGYQVTWLLDTETMESYLPTCHLLLVGHSGSSQDEIIERLTKEHPKIPILHISHFDEREGEFDLLIAEVESILQPARKNAISIKHITIHLDEKILLNHATGQQYPLSNKEFKILTFFLEHPNQILTKERIYQSVWGEEYIGGENTVMVHIRHLRKKIEIDSSNPMILETIRGLGYRLNL